MEKLTPWQSFTRVALNSETRTKRLPAPAVIFGTMMRTAKVGTSTVTAPRPVMGHKLCGIQVLLSMSSREPWSRIRVWPQPQGQLLGMGGKERVGDPET